MAKLNSVRKGDRAEYITQGIFSALRYSVPVLRQEDFGLDFLCTSVESAGKISFPTKSFTVQLKTFIFQDIICPVQIRLSLKTL
jgi:hypothetical protein